MTTLLRRLIVIAIAAALIAPVIPTAAAHEITEGPHAGEYPHETEDWFRVWLDLVIETGGLTPELVELRAALFEEDAAWAHSRSVLPIAPSDRAAARPRKGIDRWRPLVSLYFEPRDIDWAMAIIKCESRGDPNARNPRSSARGLFQHLARYWPKRSQKAGWEGASIYDPEANIAVAAWLFYEGGGKSHWTCKA